MVTTTEATTREAWLEERRKGVGASEVPTILGLSPFKDDTPLRLWALKTERIEPDEQTEAMRIGHVIEDTIDRLFQLDTGRRTRNLGDFTIQRNPAFPLLGCTLDRVQDDPSGSPLGHDMPGTLQIKNVGHWMSKHWENEIGDQIVPDYTDAQCQAEMAAAKMTWGSAAVLIGGNDFRWADIERRPDSWFDDLQEALAAFWDCVRTDTPPEATAKDAKIVKHLYPDHEPKKIASLPIEAVDIAAELERLKAEKKAVVAEIDALEARVKGWIGDAERGVAPDGSYWNWKAYDQKAYSVAATKKRPLKMYRKK